MKKRLLIASHCLEIGGAERSLIGFLDELSKNGKLSVDLFLYRHEGPLMKYIPDGIRLLPRVDEYSCLAVPLKSVIKRGHFLIGAGRLWAKLKAKRYIKKQGGSYDKSCVGLEYSHKYTVGFMPEIADTEYDMAISFLTPHYFVSEHCKAKKKLAFIHTDYSYILTDKASETEMWDKYDCIAAVSDSVAKAFRREFPALEKKVTVIENINPVSMIRLQAEEAPLGMDFGGVKILSVGRFCEQKNFESIPKKLSLLRSMGVDAKWYIIGFGDDSLINKAIAEHGMQDCVINLGKKENPYPYILACDIYAQPSRYEGKAVTVLEAQILGKPVIISNYATASSQLEDGVDGVIAPMDDEGFAQKLYELLGDSDALAQLSKNCLARDYSNSASAKQLVSLI